MGMAHTLHCRLPAVQTYIYQSNAHPSASYQYPQFSSSIEHKKNKIQETQLNLPIIKTL